MAKKEFNITGTRKLTKLLGDVRRQNNFILTIGGLKESNLELIIQRAFLPKVSLSVIELRHGNDALKLAGAASWEGGTVTVLDVLSRDELDAILDWRDQTYKDGVVGIAHEYKKDGYVTEYAANGRFIRKWALRGMWINDLDYGELNAAVAEGKEISFQVQIDPSPTRPTYEEYDEILEGDGDIEWESN